MASRLVGGVLYSDNNGVIVNNSNRVEKCVYKLKWKHSVMGYICSTSCGCTNKWFKNEPVCDYCGRVIEFVGRKGQPRRY